MKTNILFFVLLSLSRVLCAEELVDDTEPGVYLSGIQAGREVDRWGDVLFAVATKDGDYPVILRSVVGKKGEQSSVSLRFTLRISKGVVSIPEGQGLLGGAREQGGGIFYRRELNGDMRVAICTTSSQGQRSWQIAQFRLIDEAQTPPPPK